MWKKRRKADCVELEAVHMRKYLSKKGGASGSCGWGHKELKALHERLHDSLAEIFNAMEKAGVSPTVSHEGDVTLIPKGIEAAGVDNLRPITVLSSLHRVWAATRLEADLFQWQEGIIGELPLKACRKGVGTDDLACPLALYLERSRQGGEASAWRILRPNESLRHPELRGGREERRGISR